MRTTLLILFFSISLIGIAQQQKRLFVGLTKGGLVNPLEILSFPLELLSSNAIGETISYNQYGVEVGSQINSKFRLSIDFTLYNYDMVEETPDYPQGFFVNREREIIDFQLGLVLSHRLFEQAKVVSPKFRYKFGAFLSGGVYASTDIMASMRFDDIMIDLGGNLNYLSTFITGQGIGIGYTFSVSYLIPRNTKNK